MATALVSLTYLLVIVPVAGVFYRLAGQWVDRLLGGEEHDR